MFSVHPCVFLFYRLFLNTVVILAIWRGSFVLSTGKSHFPCFVKQAFSCWIMFPIFSQSSEYLYDCKTCYYCYYKKEAGKKSPQEGTQAYVVCPIFAANYKRSWLKKKSGFSKTKWTLWLQANTTQIQPVTLGSINGRKTKKALCPYLTLTQRTKITAEHRNMDTNKATPDLKPSAQPPSPEDLMEARRVDEEGSKVPARESIYTGAGHIIRISWKSWFISLIPFRKSNL